MTLPRTAQSRLLAVADRMEPGLRHAFLQALNELRDNVVVSRVAAMIAAGDVEGAVMEIFDTPEARAALARISERYQTEIAKRAPLELKALPLSVDVRVGPYAQPIVDAVRRWENQTFDNVRRDMMAGARDYIARGIANGEHPKQIASSFKSDVGTIGLTEYDESIVRNYRNELEGGKITRAQRRKLRDRRYDTKDTKKYLSPKEIDARVDAYRRKLVALRAQTMARTAAIDAANEAQLASWEAAVESGAVDRNDVRVYWVVAADERTCEICNGIAAAYPNGIRLGDVFFTPDGRVLVCPTAHPSCRCTVFVRVEKAGIRRRPTPGTTRLVLPKLIGV